MFFKVMKYLSEHFFLIMIDILGMGGSSRPDFSPKNGEESDNFFVEFIEKWR